MVGIYRHGERDSYTFQGARLQRLAGGHPPAGNDRLHGSSPNHARNGRLDRAPPSGYCILMLQYIEQQNTYAVKHIYCVNSYI